MLNWNLFDLIYFFTFVVSFVIRWPYEKVNRMTEVIKSNFDLTEKIGLLLAFIGAMVLPLIYLFTPILNFSNYSISLLSGVVGSILTPLSLWLFWRSHKDLGRQWSPKLEIRESHQLITKGVYKFIRHPMYSAIFVGATCQLLLLGNWLVAPAYLVGFSLLYFSRVNREEQLMLDQFGEEYLDYMKETNRLFPRLFN